MTEDWLEKSWHDLLARTGARAGHADEFFRSLVIRYQEPQRAYHTLDHIRDMIKKLDQQASQSIVPDSLYYATWYHDAVYHVDRKTMGDNETASATLAEKELAKLGLDQTLIDTVSKMIIASKSHSKTTNDDVNQFLDCDMSILGAAPVAYKNYAGQIRQEHHTVPKIVFNYYRRKFLKAVLKQDQIFLTDYYRQHYEKQARENLAWELSGFK